MFSWRKFPAGPSASKPQRPGHDLPILAPALSRLVASIQLDAKMMGRLLREQNRTVPAGFRKAPRRERPETSVINFINISFFWGTYIDLQLLWSYRKYGGHGLVQFFWWLNNRSKDFFSAKTRRCTWRMEKNLEDRGTVVVSCSRKPSNQWLDK